jgi:hypothetical protein
MATLNSRKGIARTLEISHMQNTYGQFTTTTVKLPFIGYPDKTVTMALTEDTLDDLIKLLARTIGVTTTLT